MVLTIPCGKTAIRFYKQHREKGFGRVVRYRAACSAPGDSVNRVWGNQAKSLQGALESLFGRMKVSREDREAAWSELSKHADKHKPAISHKSSRTVRQSTVVFFKKAPWQGTIRHIVQKGRKRDGKVRLVLSRKGETRVLSNWHSTRDEAFEHIRKKCISMNRDEPAISHTQSVEEGVKAIHQIYGLYRDGKEMSDLFKLSSKAWEAYARREQCEYRLWGADDVDTLMQRESPDWVLKLYRDVRFTVQRADIARFFILYQRGGLYADLDTFPNIDRFAQVPLGMCKMLARETKAMRNMPEWEIEVVVAEKGNPAILEILEDMKIAMAEKEQMRFYANKPCRFIYRTTGPVQVGKTLERRGYQPQVTVFSMCRPVHDLEKLISLDGTGRVTCQRSGMESYDVLSAFSMSYNTDNPRPPPPLAMPLHQLPTGGLPASATGGEHPPCVPTTKAVWRRYSIKKPQLPDAEVKHRPTTALVEQKETQPRKGIDEQKLPGYQPQEQRHQTACEITQVERRVFDDMMQLFLTQRKCAAVEGMYSLLQDKSRAYIRCFREF